MVVSASYKGADQFRQDYTKGIERSAHSFETERQRHPLLCLTGERPRHRQGFRYYRTEYGNCNSACIGSDTTSTSIAATLHYLSYSPRYYQKAADDVRSRFTRLDEVRLSPTLNSCTYLRTYINEALRISPPGGGPLWREVHTVGSVIDGVYITEGCDVGVRIHSIHRNPAYYPEPFTYNLDLWLKSEKGAEELETMRKAYVPFGTSPRTCVGKSLALMELMLTMAALLWQFDFRASNRDEQAGTDGKMVAEQSHLKDHVTGQKDAEREN
jgi:Cytochrome P450